MISPWVKSHTHECKGWSPAKTVCGQFRLCDTESSALVCGLFNHTRIFAVGYGHSVTGQNLTNLNSMRRRDTNALDDRIYCLNEYHHERLWLSSQTPEALTTLRFSVYGFININQGAHPQLNTIQAWSKSHSFLDVWTIMLWFLLREKCVTLCYYWKILTFSQNFLEVHSWLRTREHR